MKGNTQFSLDESELDVAIEKALNIKRDDRAISQQNYSADGQRDEPKKEGTSTQEVLDGREELENFFKRQEEEQATPNYLKDDEEGISEDETASKEGSDADVDTSDPEDTSTDETTDKDSSDQSNEKQDADPVFTYDDIIDIIKEEQLLYIPDDFDGELDADTIDQFKQQTRELQRWELINELRSTFESDPQKLQYFDYFMTGQADADLPKYMDLSSRAEQYSNLDVSNEENQKAILTEFLKEGLDPNNPAHRLRLQRVNDEVEEILSNYEGEQKAKEAKQYFVDKHRQQLEREEQRVVEARKQRELQQQQELARQMAWHEEFRKTLDSKSWSPSKKQAILEEQYGEVQISEDQFVPVWWAKEMMIKQDPVLYQTYLDWLHTSFDLESGTFRNQESDMNTAVTRKILEMANKKQGRRKSYSSTGGRSTGSSTKKTAPVNPLENL